jgi:hypothetical protein
MVSPLQLFVVDSKCIMTSIAPEIRQSPKDGGSDKRVDIDIDIDIDIEKGPQIFALRAANRVFDQVVASFFFEKPSQLPAVGSSWTFLSDLDKNAVP